MKRIIQASSIVTFLFVKCLCCSRNVPHQCSLPVFCYLLINNLLLCIMFYLYFLVVLYTWISTWLWQYGSITLCSKCSFLSISLCFAMWDILSEIGLMCSFTWNYVYISLPQCNYLYLKNSERPTMKFMCTKSRSGKNKAILIRVQIVWISKMYVTLFLRLTCPGPHTVMSFVTFCFFLKRVKAKFLSVWNGP